MRHIQHCSRRRSRLDRLLAGLDDRFGLQAGVTMIEIIVALGVVGVLALMAVPWLNCSFQKSHFVQVMEDMRQARALIEAYEAELGTWPPDLQGAFGSRKPPNSLIYCTESNDGNSGHGNEYCTFFDSGNSSGQNQHGGAPEAGYILRTYDDLARCANVRMAWLKCCGEEPRIVSWGDEETGLPGHPSTNGQGNGPGP